MGLGVQDQGPEARAGSLPPRRYDHRRSNGGHQAHLLRPVPGHLEADERETGWHGHHLDSDVEAFQPQGVATGLHRESHDS